MRILLSTALVLALSGCGGDETTSSSTTEKPAPAASTPANESEDGYIDVTGRLSVRDPSMMRIKDNGYLWCLGRGPVYGDLYYGTPVTIYDATGTKVALGELDEGVPTQNMKGCDFDILVEDVPSEPGVLTLEIADRPEWSQDFTIKEFEKSPKTALWLFLGM